MLHIGYGAMADAIFPTHQFKEGKGSSKKYGNETKYVGMAKRFSKKSGNKGCAFNYPIPAI